MLLGERALNMYEREKEWGGGRSVCVCVCVWGVSHLAEKKKTLKTSLPVACVDHDH